MSFVLKHLAQRLVGRGPVVVRSFDDVCAGRSSPDPLTGELAAAPADECDFHPTLSLLGQAAVPELVEGAPRYAAAGQSRSDRRRLLSLTEAGVAGDDAVVYCPSQRIAVEETVRQWNQPPSRHPLLAAPRFPAAEHLPGLTLSLGTLDAGGFYHFLMESLPKLQLARPWLDRADHILANGSPGSFQERWLAHAGVPTSKIRWLGGLSHFHCDQALFTNWLCPDSEPTPWLLAAIRAVLSAPATPRPGTRRIWISRGDAGSRQVAWENDLLRQLGSFERVELARLIPAEQIALMAEATVIAGPHGAGLANLVFCAPGTRIVELMPDLRHRPLYSRMALAAGCTHAWASADFTRPAENLEPIASAIRAFAA